MLGRGGMGAVYAATDLTNGKRVAVKRMHASDSDTMRELFKREFHTLHGLRHPNVIEVYDFGDDAGLFYTMELLEGHDLGRAAPLTWRLVCDYLRQVAAPLALLHARRLLHRDVSPRNLWILPSGRLKLIDFGTLSSFGVPTEVIGTLPLLAPEWLFDQREGIRVDQRADLYSLGALGYWLLTGVHAYAIVSEKDVPQCWMRPLAPPSSLVALSPVAGLEAVPPELDALIIALLRTDPASRPESIAHVIDRIDAIAGPAHEQADHAVRGCLRSKAFVGRTHALSLLEEQLRDCAPAQNVIAIEAAPGLGRSRLLEELALCASLSGAISVLVRAREHDRPYGVANALALALCEQLPRQATAAAGAHAAELAQLSQELRGKLELPASAQGGKPASRQQLQTALSEWVLELVGKQRLLIFIDDLECCDEESARWLAVLARPLAQQGAQRVQLVLSLVCEPGIAPALAFDMFRSLACRVQLSPLTAAEVLELLHSVFGPATYLQRVAEVVYRESQGSPAHCLELLEHLIDRGLARYAEGTWTLPGHLPVSELPRSRSELHLARFRRVSTDAQRLARCLSICDVPLSGGDCNALSPLTGKQTAAALVELVLGGVLVESDRGYGFQHRSVREHALASLPAGERVRAHELLGERLLASARDPLDGMRAGLHLYRAGHTRRCQLLVTAAVRYLLHRGMLLGAEAKHESRSSQPPSDNRERWLIAVPLLVQAVELLREAGAGPDALAAPLAALAEASYFVDHRLAQRYGAAALDTLEHLLCFDTARRLAPRIGRKSALRLSQAAAALSRRSRVHELRHMLLNSVITLNGVAVSSVDLAMTERCAHALEPLAVLGEHHFAGFVHRAVRAIAGMQREQHAATLAELRSLAALIENGAVIRHMSDNLRPGCLIGLLYPIGIMECWRMNPEALAIAARIEAVDALHGLSADHLRAVYYAMRGESVLAAAHRRRVETRALQVGAAWQVVTLGPVDAQLTALWTHDAQLAKHAAAELERLSHELPTMRHLARDARATYLVLCGRYPEVIELLAHTADDTPKGLVGWMRGQGMLARAHNRLGEHTRARELCHLALAERTPEDLSFVVMHLHLQLELALADAALGEHARAWALAQQLLIQHAGAGPLALGAIHETCARVALLASDHALATRHCVAMRRSYAPTESASLFELGEQLEEQIAHSKEAHTGALDVPEPNGHNGAPASLTTCTQLTRASSRGEDWEVRLRRGLEAALETAQARSGFVMPTHTRESVIHVDGQAPEPEVVSWAHAVRSGGEATVDMLPDSTFGYLAKAQMNGAQHCLVPLCSSSHPFGAPAVLVLSFDEACAKLPDAQVFGTLASSLSPLCELRAGDVASG